MYKNYSALLGSHFLWMGQPYVCVELSGCLQQYFVVPAESISRWRVPVFEHSGTFLFLL